MFAGIRFDGLDNGLLYVFAKNENIAAKIEDKYALHIRIVAGRILGANVDVVVVVPKVLQ